MGTDLCLLGGSYASGMHIPQSSDILVYVFLYVFTLYQSKYVKQTILKLKLKLDFTNDKSTLVQPLPESMSTQIYVIMATMS